MIAFPDTYVAGGANEEEWIRLRLGRPTASEFSSILTPALGKKSASQKPFAARHVDERVTGGPKDVKPAYSNHNMERGNLREHEAAMAFERETGLLTRKIGYCCTDDGRFGGSPDRLVAADEEQFPFAGLEIKNYAAAEHFQWQEENALPNDFKCQVHGCMIVTGLREWYWMNYCPPYDPIIVRVLWDDFTTKLAEALEDFDKNVFRPMLARQCENSVIRSQVEQFDREYAALLAKAKAAA